MSRRMTPVLHAKEWKQIVASLTGRDQLLEIRQAILDGEEASLNEQDWAEVFHALVDGGGDAEQSIAEKIGPDGRNMVGVTCACGALMDGGVCSDPNCRFNVRD